MAGPIFFSVDDPDTPLNQLNLSAVSSNTSLVPVTNIQLLGNGADRSVTIEPVSNENGTVDITVRVSDGKTQVGTTFELLVRPVNDAPVIDLNGNGAGRDFAATYSTAGDPVLIGDNDLWVSDIDSSQLSWARVEILNLNNGDAEQLTVDPSASPSVTSSYSGGILTLTGPAPRVQFQAALRTARYHNTATVPNLTTRDIDVSVNDGQALSNIAHSEVDIQHPEILLTIDPELQQLSSGQAAIFTMHVENTGNVELSDVQVDVPGAPDCTRSLNDFGPGAKQEFSCNEPNATQDFTVTATASALDPQQNLVESTDESLVEVENGNIQIVVSPGTQVVRLGETASFDITVSNPSATAHLKDVEVLDAAVPSCARSGLHSFHNLDAGEGADYSCALANVQVDFTHRMTATAKLASNDEMVQDTSTARVELLNIDALLVADPASMPGPGGPVNFTAQISNEGTVDVFLTALSTDFFGDLTDPTNDLLQSNECAGAVAKQLIPQEDYVCMFTAFVSGAPPQLAVNLTASAEDLTGLSVSASDSFAIELTDVREIEATLNISPPNIPAPGGDVLETITVRNLSFSVPATINSLVHSVLGALDGQGDCSLPQSLAARETYRCEVSTNVNGPIGHLETHIVAASGVDAEDLALGDEAEASVQIVNPSIHLIKVPLVAANYARLDEPNDLPCTSFPLVVGTQQPFLADDENDWYFFDLNSSGQVTVKLSSFVPEDGQIAVWTGPDCASLTQALGHDGSRSEDRSIVFAGAPGRYYVWIFNGDGEIYEQPYTLQVLAP